MLGPKNYDNLSREETLALIRQYEAEIDKKLANGEISEWTAWEVYFALMYECNLWGFEEDHERLVSKINREKFDPFKSRRPEIIFVARLILAHHNRNTLYDN